MSDDLLDYYREYGPPPAHPCSYSEKEDGTIRIDSAMDGAACISDFSEVGFYVEPKEKPKLKHYWRR
jgi:hypothetical protein